MYKREPLDLNQWVFLEYGDKLSTEEFDIANKSWNAALKEAKILIKSFIIDKNGKEITYREVDEALESILKE